MPTVRGLLETSLYVGDLGRSKAFYQDLFGFPAMLEDDRMVALGVPGEGVLLLFATGGSREASMTPQGTIPAHDGRGTQHLCFGIPVLELDAWAARLEGQVESRITWPNGGTSLYFRDPDDHSIEVATPGLWANW